jgi:hypothetical protein
VGLKLNGAHQLLVYADNLNLLGDKIDTIKKNTETLIDTNKVVGLEVNTERTVMLLIPNQNAGKNHNIKIANRNYGKCGTVQIFGNDNKTKFNS